MVKKHTSIAIAPPAPRLLANDLPTDRDLTAAQKDTLWDFTDGGAKIWKEPQDEPSKLTSNLKRLWIERGDFSQLTIESIEKQKAKPVSELEVPKSNEDDAAENQASKRSETITVDELWEMRMQMAHQLLVMSGELSTGLDLLNTLLAPLAPDAVDTTSLPLPPGGIAPMTHSLDHLSPQPEPITLINSSVSLMRKRKAAQNASCLLKRAASELGREAKRSQNEWDTLLKLREAGWNMRPKGAKPGVDMSLMGRGAERAAKEIGIAYATTEAAEALRASSFASLEPLNLDDHESTQISLKLPPRPRRRLAITLALPNQPIERFSPWERHNLEEIDILPFGEDLELARAEVLEEEIFGEISKEAQSSATYRTSTSDRSVVVKGFWEDAEISFEMLESHEETHTTTEMSSKCRLISALIRLLMVSIYRSRRSCAIGIMTANTQPSQPKILEPVLGLTVFFIYTYNLHNLFSQAVSDLKPTKLEVEAELDPILESASGMVNLICGRSNTSPQKLEVGGIAALRIMGRRLVTFTITCPVVISFWLKDEPMRIGPDQLYSVLINGINQSIIGLLIEMIDNKTLVTRKAPTGLVCQSMNHSIFLAPKFRFGTGLTIEVGNYFASNKTLSEDESMAKNLEQALLPSLGNYLGQVGLAEWVESLKEFLLT
ncbi:uncharacterized protein PGTG_04562 [Puccinia graminis f. sp. tritici CRL 75-36-700-3]|uniref:Mediator of RNA polymerase II transcription subunit 17 n=1 Tax=Puccinia graminis f. sp. tritici (strain CRL 75-36-700-3 / race SCCL) TaxID=418459 RepID=E3K2N7_PUCGT|nr:uncharacterized protein PGTG_04562 [Puccinia graminis f. sp. tritici CRL 75-36-700-3]EFP78606.2 hypothetical protein PGTG_04562 [Puccinia graminis f. sp. tritici CRL 75-36-700-3]